DTGAGGATMRTPSTGDLLFPENRNPDLGSDESPMDANGNDPGPGVDQTIEAFQDQSVLSEYPRNPVGGGIPVHGHHGDDFPADETVETSCHRLGVPGGGIESHHLQLRIVRPGRDSGSRRCRLPSSVSSRSMK